MAKKTKAEQIAAIPIENIIREWSKPGGQKKVRGYLRSLQLGYKRRVAQLARKGLDSYAQMQYEALTPKGSKMLNPNNITYNRIILEIVRLQNFFQSETSTVQGIKDVNKKQDIRIFGADKRGRPKATMTRSERNLYWQLYDEYKNQQPGATTRYGSESVQQMLAEVMFNRTHGDGLIGLLNELEATLAEQKLNEDLGSIPNVYMGRGPFVP